MIIFFPFFFLMINFIFRRELCHEVQLLFMSHNLTGLLIKVYRWVSIKAMRTSLPLREAVVGPCSCSVWRHHEWVLEAPSPSPRGASQPLLLLSLKRSFWTSPSPRNSSVVLTKLKQLKEVVLLYCWHKVTHKELAVSGPWWTTHLPRDCEREGVSPVRRAARSIFLRR